MLFWGNKNRGLWFAGRFLTFVGVNTAYIICATGTIVINDNIGIGIVRI